jgi:hypothetical protein
METLQNAIITFSMVNTDNGILKIASKPAYITEKFLIIRTLPKNFTFIIILPPKIQKHQEDTWVSSVSQQLKVN